MEKWGVYMLTNEQKQANYQAMVKYLKQNKIDLDKEYFSPILKAVGWVVEGHTVQYACGLCSMFGHDTSQENGHLNEAEMRKMVREITKKIKY